jgi:hypothetical protein
VDRLLKTTSDFLSRAHRRACRGVIYPVDKISTGGIKLYRMGTNTYHWWIILAAMRINALMKSKFRLYGDKLSPYRVEKLEDISTYEHWMFINDPPHLLIIGESIDRYVDSVEMLSTIVVDNI